MASKQLGLRTAAPSHRPRWHPLAWSAAIALGVGVIEYILATLLWSASAEADALHLLGDAAQSGTAAAFAYAAARTGNSTIESRSAYVQSLCLIAAGGYIIWEVASHEKQPREALQLLLLGAAATLAALVRLRVTHGSWEIPQLGIRIWRALRYQEAIDRFATVESVHVVLDLLTSFFVFLTGFLIWQGYEPGLDRIFGYAGSIVAFASAIVTFMLARMGHHHDGCDHHGHAH